MRPWWCPRSHKVQIIDDYWQDLIRMSPSLSPGIRESTGLRLPERSSRAAPRCRAATKSSGKHRRSSYIRRSSLPGPSRWSPRRLRSWLPAGPAAEQNGCPNQWSTLTLSAYVFRWFRLEEIIECSFLNHFELSILIMLICRHVVSWFTLSHMRIQYFSELQIHQGSGGYSISWHCTTIVSIADGRCKGLLYLYNLCLVLVNWRGLFESVVLWSRCQWRRCKLQTNDCNDNYQYDDINIDEAMIKSRSTKSLPDLVSAEDLSVAHDDDRLVEVDAEVIAEVHEVFNTPVVSVD